MDKLFELLQNNSSVNDINKYLKTHKKIDLNIPNKNNMRPVEYAIIQNNSNLLLYFIKKKVELDFLNDNNRTILYYPIRFNYTNIIKILLDYVDLKFKDTDHYYPIHYAILFHNDNVFDLLLNTMTNINDIYDINKNNLLMFSCISFYNHGVEKLINTQLNIQDTNTKGENILHLLTFINPDQMNVNKYIVKLIINPQCDLNQPTTINRETPIMYVVANNNIELLKSPEFKKVVNNINISIQSLHGLTIFHHAVENIKSLPCIKYLIKKYPNKCNVNKYDMWQRLPLYQLLEHIKSNGMLPEYLDYLKILIKLSNLNFKNLHNISCLDLLINMKLWYQFKDVLVHKKLMINSGMYLSIEENHKTEFINMMIDNHIYYMNKYNRDYFISINNCKRDLLKCKSILKKEFDKNNNILFNPIKKHKTTFYEFEHLNVYHERFNYYISFICGMKFLESIGYNCIFKLNKNTFTYQNYLNYGSFNISDNNIIAYYYDKNNNEYFINLKDELIEDILSSNKPLTIINLQFISDVWAHSNFLIYNKKYNLIERFDPLGYQESLSMINKLDDTLKDFFNKHGINYIFNKDNIDTQYMGIQTQKTYDSRFHCIILCIIYAVFKINNIDVSMNKLIKRIILYLQYHPNIIIAVSSYILDNSINKIFKKYNISNYQYYNFELTEDKFNKIQEEIIKFKFVNNLKKITF